MKSLINNKNKQIILVTPQIYGLGIIPKSQKTEETNIVDIMQLTNILNIQFKWTSLRLCLVQLIK